MKGEGMGWEEAKKLTCDVQAPAHHSHCKHCVLQTWIERQESIIEKYLEWSGEYQVTIVYSWEILGQV